MTEMEKLLRLAGIDAKVLKENTEPQTGDKAELTRLMVNIDNSQLSKETKRQDLSEIFNFNRKAYLPSKQHQAAARAALDGTAAPARSSENSDELALNKLQHVVDVLIPTLISNVKRYRPEMLKGFYSKNDIKKYVTPYGGDWINIKQIFFGDKWRSGDINKLKLKDVKILKILDTASIEKIIELTKTLEDSEFFSFGEDNIFNSERDNERDNARQFMKKGFILETLDEYLETLKNALKLKNIADTSVSKTVLPAKTQNMNVDDTSVSKAVPPTENRNILDVSIFKVHQKYGTDKILNWLKKTARLDPKTDLLFNGYDLLNSDYLIMRDALSPWKNLTMRDLLNAGLTMEKNNIILKDDAAIAELKKLAGM